MQFFSLRLVALGMAAAGTRAQMETLVSSSAVGIAAATATLEPVSMTTMVIAEPTVFSLAGSTYVVTTKTTLTIPCSSSVEVWVPFSLLIIFCPYDVVCVCRTLGEHMLIRRER